MGLTAFSRTVELKFLMRRPTMTELRSRHESPADCFTFTSRFVSCLSPMTVVGQLSNVHDRQLMAESCHWVSDRLGPTNDRAAARSCIDTSACFLRAINARALAVKPHPIVLLPGHWLPLDRWS